MFIEIPGYVKNLIDDIYKAGFNAYVVGGCVRDSVMNIAPNDWDACTSSTPDETAEIFRHYKLVEIGKRHGTIGVVVGKNVVEITTYRTESSYSDCRHPESVSFTKDIHDDLSRRDFTMNALAYSPYDGFVDDFGGLDDIKNRLVRAIGYPDKRFNEDALRIMRCLRFAATLDFSIEQNTADAAVRNKDLLKNISAERINCEMTKLLNAEKPSDILCKYNDIIFTILPEMNNDGYFNLDKYIDKLPKKAELRLAVMFICSNVYSEIAISALKRLKYDNRTVKAVSAIIENKDIDIIPSRPALKRLCKALGERNLFNLLECLSVLNNDRKYAECREMLNEIIENNECMTISGLAVGGNDLTALGIKGKSIGQTLNELLSEVIDEKIRNNKNELLKRAKELQQ